MKTAVIVGRFQTPYLTEGHHYLIKKAFSGADKKIIVIGYNIINPTDKDPLSKEIRENMILQTYPEVITLFLKDNTSDEIWSQNLDDLIEGYPGITLYGSRDCFKGAYTGKFPVKEIKSPIKEINATKIRQSAKDIIGTSEDFRWGIIHNTQTRFPTCYPAVDIAVICNDLLLLGRKPGDNMYCLPGGFVDPTDKDYESAAIRELTEEVLNIKIKAKPVYLGSFNTNDWRYKGSKDNIMTMLFLLHIDSSKDLEPGDDLGELRWISYSDINSIPIISHHLMMIKKLLT